MENLSQDIMIKASGLIKVFGSGDSAFYALRGVDINIKKGEFVALMGPSGSGKSTLLNCLAGLDKVDSGSIFLSGIELSNLNDSQLTMLRREQIGFIFQSFNLISTLSAMDNVLLPFTLAGKAADMDRLNELAEQLGLSSKLSRRPSQLSGGEVQRVAVLRAILSQPKVIFADEPTGNLDSYNSKLLLNFFSHEVEKINQTVVMVTHDANCASVASRVLFLKDGQIVHEILEPTRQTILAATGKLYDFEISV